MTGQTQSTFLEHYLAAYEHPLTTAQRKLDDLVEKIETCKSALKTTALNGEQSLMARHLVSSLDQGVDELAVHISNRLDNPTEPTMTQLFNEQIEQLLLICKQLSTAVLSSPRRCTSMA